MYERLAKAADTDSSRALLERVGVLVELGTKPTYVSYSTARHDDGRFALYKRYFLGRVAFAALARDQRAVAEALKIPPFEVVLTRRQGGVERDVTARLAHVLQDRLPEFIALLVFYPRGGPTLEINSRAFRERVQRFQALRVVQLDAVVQEARVAGTELFQVIGEGADRGLFLDGAVSMTPVIYHDLNGARWEEDFRKRVAPHIAAVLENPNYNEVFALLLQPDDASEREGFLRERGIFSEDLEQVQAALDVSGAAARAEARVW